MVGPPRAFVDVVDDMGGGGEDVNTRSAEEKPRAARQLRR